MWRKVMRNVLSEGKKRAMGCRRVKREGVCGTRGPVSVLRRSRKGRLSNLLGIERLNL